MIPFRSISRGLCALVGFGFAGILPAAGAASALATSDDEILVRFTTRRETVRRDAAAVVTTAQPNAGGYFDVAASLQRGERVSAALARLAVLNAPTPTGHMFWMFPMVTVMLAGKDNLDDASWKRIQELWRTYWPSRGDTENHWLLYYGSLYLASQMFPTAGSDRWFNGQSSAENMAEARDYIEHWMEVTTSHGQGEYDSPNYIQEFLIPMCLLAGWAEDAAFRQKARMMLDYILYDYVVETVDGYYGGAHSRITPANIVSPGRSPSSALAWLLFGFGTRQPNNAVTLLALSGYTPPPILERIARDRAQPYIERELKRTRWRMRHAGPQSFVVGDRRTAEVYKYSYVDPDFVLGTSQGAVHQPIQQQTWSLIWRSDRPVVDAANTFFTVQPHSSPLEASTYFSGDWDTLTDLITRSKVDYDSPDKLTGGSPYEQVFQHRAAVIALYQMPGDNRFPQVTAFFSRDLSGVTEDASGWIFAQAGPVYVAYRPFARGEWKPNDWTGLLASGAGGTYSAGFNQWGVGHRCYVSAALHNGCVVQVAPTRDYATYSAFQTAIRALPLEISTDPHPSATFVTLDGAVLRVRYGEIPSVNTVPVDHANWPLFDSPFAHEARGSRRLRLSQGDESYLLDFANNVTERSPARAP